MVEGILLFNDVGVLPYSLYLLGYNDNKNILYPIPLYISGHRLEYEEQTNSKFCYLFRELTTKDQNKYRAYCKQISIDEEKSLKDNSFKVKRK